MYAICNVYDGRGAYALYDRLFRSGEELSGLLRSIPGFVSYTMVRTDDGGYSLVVVEQAEQLGEVGRVAGDYIKSLAADLGPVDPTTSLKGVVGLHI